MHLQLIGLRRRRLRDQPSPQIHRRPQLVARDGLLVAVNVHLAQDEMRIRQRRPARPLPLRTWGGMKCSSNLTSSSASIKLLWSVSYLAKSASSLSSKVGSGATLCIPKSLRDDSRSFWRRLRSLAFFESSACFRRTRTTRTPTCAGAGIVCSAWLLTGCCSADWVCVRLCLCGLLCGGSLYWLTAAAGQLVRTALGPGTSSPRARGQRQQRREQIPGN